MDFFSHFNSGWEQQYDPQTQSLGGNLFRSTMMVAAISFALREDLRNDFRELGFPVSDEIYDDLIHLASTGIRNIDTDFPLLIYPNPSSSDITVTGLPFGGNDMDIRVFDSTGRQLLLKSLEFNSSRIHIDLSSLPVGLYIAVIRSGTKTWSRKIIRE